MAVLNPYRQRGWGDIYLDGYKLHLKVPGSVQDIKDCDRVSNWVIQQPTAFGFGVTIYRGQKLVESPKVVMHLPDEETFDAYLKFAEQVETKRLPDGKPSVWYIINPAFNFAKITRVGVRSTGTPRRLPRLNWEATLDLVEYRPPVPVKIGPPDPPHKDQTENELLAAEAEKLAAKAREL